ncbi:hypothetical protein K7X08_021795 [Anisodus acutangulus]|uniref:Uncharacterized protein n=1 Tax=Anisodus acutangulus TaxID=402998 RepID=A0A9Q1M630_9SOLA|nr:hypothetical protein K7X08_021795 [Anisodus acutangulus]
MKENMNNTGSSESNDNDMVSGFLYDRLQKEVLCSRKFCETKESALNTKDEEIKMLMKKIETLYKAIEVESRKMKSEAAIREKYLVSTKTDDTTRSINSLTRLKEEDLGEDDKFDNNRGRQEEDGIGVLDMLKGELRKVERGYMDILIIIRRSSAALLDFGRNQSSQCCLKP